MTVSSTTRKAGPFNGNGVTTQFPFTFKVFAASDLLVVRTDPNGVETELALTADYTIALNADQDANPGGTITMLAAPATGYRLTSTSQVPNLQPTDITNGGGFYPMVIEDAIDRGVIQVQQLTESVNRSMVMPLSSDLASFQLAEGATAAGRADKVIGFDAAGSPTLHYASGTTQLGIDLANTAAGKGAAIIGTNDAGGLFSSSTVEAVLQELGTARDAAADRAAQFVVVTDYEDLVVGGDWTAAIEAAAAVGRRVYIPAGTYPCLVDTLPSGTTLFGDGVNTILAPLTADSRGAITINSASAVTFVDDLTFRDLKFFGTVAANGFSEQKHLLTLNGVRNCLVERCWFVGFRGDGLYIGSGDVGGNEKHNHNVTVRKCVFDGVNNDNRQGISVIDCDGLTIDDNMFVNCTKSTMPGAIDIEPDVAAYHVNKNIRITKNKFSNVGGNLGVISVFFASDTIPLPENVLIADNEFQSSVTSTLHAEIFIGTTRTFLDSTIDMGVVVRGNRGRGGSRVLDTRAAKGLLIEGNTFESYQSGSFCGAAAANNAPRNITYRDNRFIRCGSVGGIGLEVFTVDYLTLENNLFDDCGAGAAGSYAIDFNSGTSSNVALRNNIYRAPAGKTLNGIIKEAAHTFTPATNTQIGDRFLNSLSNAFQAEESDMAETAYSPVVEGATTAGAGVYTTQIGRYQRQGKRVKFWAHVDVQAGHTGSGLIELSLPVAAKSETPLIPISVLGAEGVTNTERTAMGMLNTAATAGGVQGAVRMYANAAAGAAQTQLTIPAGAFKLWIAGEYMAA